MRLFPVLAAALVLAAPAAAATPRFALFDLQTDLAPVSHNAFGDVQVQPLAKVAGRGTLARCAAGCRFGAGWLAFRGAPRLAPADVAAAGVHYTKRLGWTVKVALTRAGRRSWTVFARRLKTVAKRRGVPDVLVVVARGTIAAAPLSNQVFATSGALTLTGFSRASAKALATQLP